MHDFIMRLCAPCCFPGQHPPGSMGGIHRIMPGVRAKLRKDIRLFSRHYS
jgi:hypothetical protein